MASAITLSYSQPLNPSSWGSDVATDLDNGRQKPEECDTSEAARPENCVTQISMKYLKSPSPISRYHTPPIISVIEGQGLVLVQLSFTLEYRAAIILNLITHWKFIFLFQEITHLIYFGFSYKIGYNVRSKYRLIGMIFGGELVFVGVLFSGENI